MTQYIDKAAVVVEIERRKQVAFGWLVTAPNDAIQAEFDLCDNILSFIDTLETKEGDLEEDVDRILEEYDWNYDKIDFYEFAKHFYELGLKAKGE